MLDVNSSPDAMNLKHNSKQNDYLMKIISSSTQ